MALCDRQHSGMLSTLLTTRSSLWNRDSMMLSTLLDHMVLLYGIRSQGRLSPHTPILCKNQLLLSSGLNS